MFFKISQSDPRRIILVEFNPFQILVAEISRSRRGEVVLESAAEFEPDDFDGFGDWIASDDGRRKKGFPVLCSLVPFRGIVQRGRVQPAQLAKPGYLEELIQEGQKGRFLTSTPFKIGRDGTWTFRAVNAVDGSSLPPTGPAQPALICALVDSEMVEAGQRLLDHQLVRERIEPGLLSLFGAVYSLMERRRDARAVAIIVVLDGFTSVYILGKEGVHTPSPVLHGMNSIVELGRKELGANDDEEVLAQLKSRNQLAVALAGKLVRNIGRDLKPVLDSFELTTGQPVEEIFCAYLPPSLNWLAPPLAQSAGRQPFGVNCSAWLAAAKMRVAEGVPSFGPHWLGALNVVASLPAIFGLKPENPERASSASHPPWHVDCRIISESERRELTGWHLMAGMVAAVLLALSAWQLYIFNSLRSDTARWENGLKESRKLFEQLTTAKGALKKQAEIFDRAYALMAEPFQLSDFLVNLGRTIPPRMRIDRIESNDQRVVINGTLLETADEASGTLGGYMDRLRQDAGIGPLFSRIAITMLQRKPGGDDVIFELSLHLNRSTP